MKKKNPLNSIENEKFDRQLEVEETSNGTKKVVLILRLNES